MTFDPNCFIALSREFSEDDKSEAEYRTAINRAYYGIFLLAREELSSREQPVKTGHSDEHSKVRECFRKKPFRNDTVAHRLGSLYGDRAKADYNLEVTIGHPELKQSLEYVDYIIKAFHESLFNRPPHTA